MKKIILFQNSAAIGGATISLIDNALHLKNRGYKVKIIYYQDGPVILKSIAKGIDSELLSINSVFVYGTHVPFSFIMLIKFLFYFPLDFIKIKNLIKKENPDLLLFNTSIHITAAMASYGMGIPTIWYIRECLGKNKIIRYIHQKMIYKFSSNVVLVSDYLRKYFKENKKIVTIYNGIDLEKFKNNNREINSHYRSRFGFNKDDFIICKIGGIQNVKGDMLLVEVAKEIFKSKNRVKFLIIGGHSDYKFSKNTISKIKYIIKIFFNLPLNNYDKMQRQIKKYNLEDKFVFTKPDYKINEILPCVDLLSFLSLEPEGFGRPLIEAMASNIPILSFDIGPTREIVGAKSCFLIEKSDPKDIACKVLSIYKDILCNVDRKWFNDHRLKNNFNKNLNYKKLEKLISNTISNYMVDV